MFNFNNIRSIAAVALASASLLTSCVGLEEDSNDAVGYLDVPALEVDLAVDDLLLTKALDFKVNEPSVSDVHFVVKDKNGTVRYDGNGLWEEPLVLPVGSYSVEASYGSNGFGAPYFTGSAEGSIGHLDKVTPELTMKLSNSLVKVSVASSLEGHFTPGNEVSFKFNDRAHTAGYNTWTYVPAGQDISVTLALAGTTSAGTPANFTHTLSNPSPKVAYDVVCGKSETNWPEIKWTSSLADGAFEEGLYFKPAEVAKMSAENIAKLRYHIKGGDYADWEEVDVTKLPDVGGYKYLGGLSNGTEYHLRASVGNIVTEDTFTPVSFKSCLEVSEVVAAHNNAEDSSVELSGTTMTVTGVNVKLPAIIATMAEVTASGSFNSSQNNATGSFSNVELSQTSKSIPFTNAEGWPYLPQGNYSAEVTATCTLNDVIYTASSTKSSTVPYPKFKVIASAYTSYDKYQEYKSGNTNALNDANKPGCAEYINQISATVGISESLLTNSNYGETKVYYTCGPYTDYEQPFVNPDGDKNSSIKVNNIGDVGGFSWGENKLTARVVFAGASVTSEPHPCHITGLPYTANPPSNDEQKTPHPWTEDQRNNIGTVFNWGNSEFYMHTDALSGDYLRIGTPVFHVPADINITIVTSAHGCKHAALTYDTECKIYSGDDTAVFTAKYNKNAYADYTVNSLTLHPSPAKLQFENTYHSAYRKLYINKVTIGYR